VFHHGGSVRHVPFLTELGDLDEGSSGWRAVSAGLVVLRLVDAWMAEGAAVVAADEWGLRSVQAAIDGMPAGMPARTVLRCVVEAMKSSGASDMDTIAPRLMAYARSLDLDAKWALAADVYETVIAHVHPVEQSDVAINAHIRLGFTLRALGEIDRSAAIYDQASALASASGDMVGVLHAQIGAARIAITRGNLPEAERELDDAISRAARAGLESVRASALQDRADVAHLRGQYDAAVRFAYDALRQTNDPINRDRLLSDIAASFYMLGARSVARDAYLVLEATAQEKYQRWVAAINLMEIASAEGSTTIFERYRRNLLEQPLPPVLQTQLHLHIGDGYRCLGETELARTAIQRARHLAEGFQFNQLLFAAEARLASLEQTPKEQRPNVEPRSAELREIADEIKRRGEQLWAR
jgi:tetratricopeptide (TPR) repeat protein